MTQVHNVENMNKCTQKCDVSQFVQIKKMNCSMSSLSNILFDRLKVSYHRPKAGDEVYLGQLLLID